MQFAPNPSGLMGLTDDQCKLVFAANTARFNPHKHCTVLEFEPGLFAIYGPGSSFPMLVTDDWSALEAAYRTRPAYRAHKGAPSEVPSKPTTVKGLNLGALNISI